MISRILAYALAMKDLFQILFWIVAIVGGLVAAFENLADGLPFQRLVEVANIARDE